MNILITGHEGFIGSHLVSSLKESQMKVRGWDKTQKHDIFDSGFVAAVKWADVVIHLAALTSVGNSFENPEEVFRVNVLGTARVVELCQRYNTKLIYPSSAAVYHRELSPYASSKALAEDIVREFKNTTILRFFNIYGPNMNENSGSLMYEFVKGLELGKLVVLGDGEQTRDFIHIDDIVKIIKKAIFDKWEDVIVDCGSGQAYSINYIAGLFQFYSRDEFKSLKIEYQKPRREIKWSTANTQMLKRLYKNSLKDIEEGIKEVVKFYEAD